MSQQQLGRGPLRSDGANPAPPDDRDSPPARFVGWLGSLGCAAAGYGVFQALFGILPDSLGGTPAKWLVSLVSGVGTALAAWLAAALLRTRSAGPTRVVAVPVRVATADPGPLPGVFAATYEALADQVTVVDDPVRGRL
ncbi:hypothetical protein IPZ69_44135, partial [Streptomyces olivochromogenes]|nr:hypothetical protein [Streptomyces olivochromogenes]